MQRVQGVGCWGEGGAADVPALSPRASHPGPLSAPTLALGGANPVRTLHINFVIILLISNA